MSQSAEQDGMDRTLQIVTGLYTAGILAPAENWKLKDGVDEQIDADLIQFVQDGLPRLLYVVFTLRHDLPALTQLCFITHMSDIIYQSWLKVYPDNGKEQLLAKPFAQKHGFHALCSALAIYVKTTGVEQNLLMEEKTDDEGWVVRCVITNNGEWACILNTAPPLTPSSPTKIPT